jgi:amino acid transporter
MILHFFNYGTYIIFFIYLFKVIFILYTFTKPKKFWEKILENCPRTLYISAPQRFSPSGGYFMVLFLKMFFSFACARVR